MSAISALPVLYTEAEAAEYLGVSKMTLQRMRRRGDLKFIRVGGRAKYKQSNLLDFLESQQCHASASPTNTRSSSAPDRRTGTSNGASAGRKSAAVAALEALKPPA